MENKEQIKKTETAELQNHTPTEEKKTKTRLPHQKWLIIGVVIFVFLMMGGVILLGKNNSSKPSPLGSPKPTAKAEAPNSTNVENWKTYTNSKYNYSIDYPGNWYNREFSDEKTGSAFTKSSKPNDYTSESITINVNNKTLNDYGVPFETYVKTAAIHEIQNYKSLASIKKITTDGGIVGYETTWKVQSIGPGGTGDSLPRTYFAIPNNSKATIQVELSKEEDLAIYEKMLTTFKITEQTQKNQETFLEVPLFGIKFALSEDIKDAYVVTPKSGTKDYVYLKVHSLDNEPQCNSDESSTAALSKVGKDDVNEMSGKKYSESYNGATVGNSFYYTDLAQYECAESPAGKAKLELVRKAFSSASSKITNL